jgi:hypothetical protein
MEAILQAHEHPGANTLLLRRTFPELEQSLLLYFKRDVPRELYENFQESKHVVTWRNGSTTRFGYCARESDVYQYQGAEFLFIGIDELTLFTLRQWQFLTSRNRCPVAGAFPCMAGATNPGNIGHAWVKALWIDREPAPGMEHPEEYDAADYDFIPARVADNPIYAGDEQYLKTLRALPSHLKRAFLDGDWDVFAGQYFDRFDCSRHVVRAEEIDWKPWWPRWISVDWGFEHPAAVYWHAQGQWESASGGGERYAGRGILRSAQDDYQNPGQEKLRDGRGAQDDYRKPGQEQLRDGRSAQDEYERLKHDQLRMGIGAQDDARYKGVVTYREYLTRRTPPRELAREIVVRCVAGGDSGSGDSGAGFGCGAGWRDRREMLRCAQHDGEDPRRGFGEREKIDAIYLSPDAFARRTDERRLRSRWGMCLRRRGCRVLCRPMTIAWAVGC